MPLLSGKIRFGPCPRPAHSPSRAPQSGFTFIELTVTVLILLVLVAVIAPRLAPGTEQVHLRATASSIASIAAAGRHAAVFRKADCCLRCASDAPHCELACTTMSPGKKISEVKVKTYEWKYGSPARARGESEEAEEAQICFHPDGTATGPALEITVGDRNINLEVFSATGLPYAYETEK